MTERLLEAMSSRLLKAPRPRSYMRRRGRWEGLRGKAEPPHVDCLHQIFETRADARPKAVAVAIGGEEITYAELERRADRLAHHLRARGVGRGSLVALLLPRSVDAYATILGILKAGAAYVPLDPEYPFDRVAYILQDCGAEALVTTSELARHHVEFSGALVQVDADGWEIAARSSSRPPNQAGARDLCYVIYTSGSTGRPKGVMMEHRNACHWYGPRSRSSRGAPRTASTRVLARLRRAPCSARSPGATRRESAVAPRPGGDRSSWRLRGAPRLHFSLSHADGLALCAVVVGCDVGADVESLRAVGPDPLGVAGVVCAPREIEAPPGLPATARARHLLFLWTRREAIAKATGLGFYLPLSRIAVGGNGGPPASWTVRSFALQPHHLAAVALAVAPGDRVVIYVEEEVP